MKMTRQTTSNTLRGPYRGPVDRIGQDLSLSETRTAPNVTEGTSRTASYLDMKDTVKCPCVAISSDARRSNLSSLSGLCFAYWDWWSIQWCQRRSAEDFKLLLPEAIVFSRRLRGEISRNHKSILLSCTEFLGRPLQFGCRSGRNMNSVTFQSGRGGGSRLGIDTGKGTSS